MFGIKVFLSQGTPTKEELQVYEELIRALRAIEERVKHEETPQVPLILFQCRCQKCGEITSHLSHIGGFGISSGIAATACLFSPRPPPLKTCLACGTETYRDSEV